MMTGYEIHEAAAILAARFLRDPANWPSLQEGSEALRLAIARGNRARMARRQLQSFLARYESRVA